MQVIERGVLSDSRSYFHTPSQIAKKLFYYPICVGYFHCNQDYHLRRASYPSILAMYVKSGKGTVTAGGQTHAVKAGDLVLLDCYEPHEYRGVWETLWCHFDGKNSREYFRVLRQNAGIVYPLPEDSVIPQQLSSMLADLREKDDIREALFACRIEAILAELYDRSCRATDETKNSGPIRQAIHYIRDHYSEKLSLQDLASLLNMSPYYFSRLFKKHTGYSPYEYITFARLDRAKTLLKTTDDTIKEITFATGFGSEANFITCFKKHNNCTPRQFREMPF
ncbi:MAG: AraC family transcriptional regulator [Selenomonadaceae bacterium]|nr:AraC family transcriptional regulator [Selenomonadaceae bacterium]